MNVSEEEDGRAVQAFIARRGSDIDNYPVLEAVTQRARRTLGLSAQPE